MMLSVLKAGCLLVYALGIAGLAGLLPGQAGVMMPRIAGAMLAAHVIELLFAWKHVRLYQGSLGASVLLTLLFGLFHWKPLADARARGEAA